MTKLILLRHGQTDWNIQGLYQGHTDIPLNQTGREQAEQAAVELKDTPFDIVYCSDLTRARQTAEAVLKFHPEVPIIIDQRLRERNFGDLEGANYRRDILNQPIYTEIKANPSTFRFPNGESLVDVRERAETIYEEILKNHPDETVLIVSHGSFLAVLSTIINGDQLSERRKYMFNNAEPVFAN